MVGACAGLDGTESVHGASHGTSRSGRSGCCPGIHAAGLPAATAHADPVVVFPGMEILQDNRMCTLGYVDAAQQIAYTAGHCRSTGNIVTDQNRNVIGHLATFRDNTPSGSTVATDQVITDYEAIALDRNIPVNNILPGGRQLVSSPNVALRPARRSATSV